MRQRFIDSAGVVHMGRRGAVRGGWLLTVCAQFGDAMFWRVYCATAPADDAPSEVPWLTATDDPYPTCLLCLAHEWSLDAAYLS